MPSEAATAPGPPCHAAWVLCAVPPEADARVGAFRVADTRSAAWEWPEVGASAAPPEAVAASGPLPFTCDTVTS
ncbi:hypothetical protein PR202_ga26575 [Eleusine coracana subsp. coracana]|uniref:Secreted protein n=1 Tax=Eleusine coracana subsp. coracana TaxID=191504 RepID=A0AAV5DEL3_ELECO|nr:hypothetical protein PR202_ga26575 [Eleusine coracana subsp. coracana]